MKCFRLCLIALMTALLLCGCGEKEEVGSVYYLNFKPEAAATWEEIAKAYTAETGVEVKILTAASGNYEQTLKAEIAKREAPTLFQINGPVGYATWKNLHLVRLRWYRMETGHGDRFLLSQVTW